MLEKIKAMWNRVFGPFYTEGPTTINNYGELYQPVIEAVTPKLPENVIVNGMEYEWWVHANVPWDWPGYFSVGKSPNYDIYRRLNYEELAPFESIFKDGSPMVELIATKVHDVWAGWMKYQFTRGLYLPYPKAWKMDGSAYRRWQRQMITPYSELPEEEKESDRKIAKEYLRLIMGR
jgi:hypothetical protein